MCVQQQNNGVTKFLLDIFKYKYVYILLSTLRLHTPGIHIPKRRNRQANEPCTYTQHYIRFYF